MTKRKKELVELMYEAGIREFPHGGEFAAQDKLVSYANCVSFFKHARPKIDGVNDVWHEDGAGEYLRGESIELSSLCKNWHRTVVTREQYAEYCKMREHEEYAIGEADEAEKCVSGGEHTQPSIIDMMHHCNELREITIAKKDEAMASVDSYNNAMESLKSAALALGYKIEPIDVSSELSPSEEAGKPLNITDWRDLLVGDVIECLPGGGWRSVFIGEQCTVKRLEPKRYNGPLPILALHQNGSEDWGGEFKFIRRP